MRFTAKIDTIYTITRYERKQVGMLRKVSILKNIPFHEWTGWEVEDLITTYDIYFIARREREMPLPLYQFLRDGEYERLSPYEELKSNSPEPYQPKKEITRTIKLKRI